MHTITITIFVFVTFNRGSHFQSYSKLSPLKGVQKGNLIFLECSNMPIYSESFRVKDTLPVKTTLHYMRVA